MQATPAEARMVTAHSYAERTSCWTGSGCPPGTWIFSLIQTLYCSSTEGGYMLLRLAGTGCLSNYGSPDDCHEPVAEHTLIARNLLLGPHSWQDLGTREVVLDINWERPEFDETWNATSHLVLCSGGINSHIRLRDSIFMHGLELGLKIAVNMASCICLSSAEGFKRFCWASLTMRSISVWTCSLVGLAFGLLFGAGGGPHCSCWWWCRWCCWWHRSWQCAFGRGFGSQCGCRWRRSRWRKTWKDHGEICRGEQRRHRGTNRHNVCIAPQEAERSVYSERSWELPWAWMKVQAWLVTGTGEVHWGAVFRWQAVMQVTQTQWMATTLTSARPMASTEAELASWRGCLSACSLQWHKLLKTSFLKSHDRGEQCEQCEPSTHGGLKRMLVWLLSQMYDSKSPPGCASCVYHSLSAQAGYKRVAPALETKGDQPLIGRVGSTAKGSIGTSVSLVPVHLRVWAQTRRVFHVFLDCVLTLETNGKSLASCKLKLRFPNPKPIISTGMLVIWVRQRRNR